MSDLWPEEQRAGYVEKLREDLNALRLAGLRQVAQGWGWSLHGNAKAEAVEQVLAFLTDQERVLPAFKKLPADEQEAASWLQVMTGYQTEARLTIALNLASGRRLKEEDTAVLLQRLNLRGLAFRDAAGRWHVPAILQDWVPEAPAPGLVWTGQLAQLPAPRPEETVEEAGNLLAAIAAEQPRAGGKSVPLAGSGRSAMQDLAPRPAPLSQQTLTSWGYTDPAEQDRANFLVSLLMAAHYCRHDDQNGRLEPAPQGLETWEAAKPAARYQSLQTWWLTDGLAGSRTKMPWHEFDLALGRVKGYRIPINQAWYYGMEPLEQDIGLMRQFVIATVQLLEPDRWYSLDAFGKLLYGTHRDLLALRQPNYGLPPRWYRQHIPQNPPEMSLSTWRETYGVLLETLMTGPAAWLYFVEIGADGGRPVAFRRAPHGEPQPGSLPPDALLFRGDEIVLRNLWQAAPLRELVRHIGVAVVRSRISTTYRLDARPFRDALRAGITAEALKEGFASSGFRLPNAIEARLADWQAKAGRYQLYDNVAVIEVSDDLALPEIQAASSLGRSNVYVAGSRCLIVLEPDIVPEVVEELRRKGYTPRVTTRP